MPGGDRSGPMGNGPMSGRGMGQCTGYISPGHARGAGMINRSARDGMFARGRRNRNMCYVTGMPGLDRFVGADNNANSDFFSLCAMDEELQVLKSRAEVLQEQLNFLVNRMQDIEEQTLQSKKQGDEEQ